MRNVFDQIFCQTTRALAWSVEMFGRQVEGFQMFDAIVSRVVHTLNRPANTRTGEQKKVVKGRCCG